MVNKPHDFLPRVRALFIVDRGALRALDTQWEGHVPPVPSPGCATAPQALDRRPGACDTDPVVSVRPRRTVIAVREQTGHGQTAIRDSGLNSGPPRHRAATAGRSRVPGYPLTLQVPLSRQRLSAPLRAPLQQPPAWTAAAASSSTCSASSTWPFFSAAAVCWGSASTR